MGSNWVEHRALNAEQKKHIAKYILPKVDEVTLDALFLKIEHAWSIDPIRNREGELSPGDLRKELKILRDRLGLVQRSLKSLRNGGDFDGLIDDHFLLVTRSDMLKVLAGITPYSSGVSMIISTIDDAVESFENEIRPSKGRARADRYVALVLDLVRFFKARIPNIEPVSTSEAPFKLLIDYLFSDVMKTGIVNAKRHVDYALELLNVQHSEEKTK